MCVCAIRLQFWTISIRIRQHETQRNRQRQRSNMLSIFMDFDFLSLRKKISRFFVIFRHSHNSVFQYFIFEWKIFQNQRNALWKKDISIFSNTHGQWQLFGSYAPLSNAFLSNPVRYLNALTYTQHLSVGIFLTCLYSVNIPLPIQVVSQRGSNFSVYSNTLHHQTL